MTDAENVLKELSKEDAPWILLLILAMLDPEKWEEVSHDF